MATIITNKADVTGITRFKFASIIRIAVSVAEPNPVWCTSRAGAIVPGTRNALLINILNPKKMFQVLQKPSHVSAPL